MSERKIPADIEQYLDVLLVIETAADAKELIEDPGFFEELEIHEMPENTEENI